MSSGRAGEGRVNWGSITPFALQRGSQFRPAPPLPVTSAAYAQAPAVTASLGQDTSTTRTASQTSIGRFWGAAPVWNVWLAATRKRLPDSLISEWRRARDAGALRSQ